MKDYIEERAISIANYIVDHNATVRQTAREFGVSKSTVHKDVTDRLMQINPTLAKEARKVLDVNKSERHIRGDWQPRRNICSNMYDEIASCKPKPLQRNLWWFFCTISFDFGER